MNREKYNKHAHNLPSSCKSRLTHIFLVDLSILINWTGPFPISGACSVLFILFWTEIHLSK